MKRILLVVAAVSFALCGSKCADQVKSSGDSMMDDAREAHEEAIDDTGGWAGRQVDTTKGRLNNSMGKGFDRLNQAGEE
jgi:hypothetical protein